MRAPTRSSSMRARLGSKGSRPRRTATTPPLDYALVHRLKRAFPQTPIAINGGIATMEGIKAQLAEVDGVMVGRAAYQNPELLLAVDPELFGEAAPFADAQRRSRPITPTSSANWRGASVFRP